MTYGFDDCTAMATGGSLEPMLSMLPPLLWIELQNCVDMGSHGKLKLIFLASCV